MIVFKSTAALADYRQRLAPFEVQVDVPQHPKRAEIDPQLLDPDQRLARLLRVCCGVDHVWFTRRAASLPGKTGT